jgi:head-tail adaptor
MSAGPKDQLITLQRRVRVDDLLGGFHETWEDWTAYSPVWANARPKGGREVVDEGRVNAVFVVVFTIYTIDALNEADHRIVWNGETYNIRGVLRAGHRMQDMKVEAERGVAS